MNANLYKAHWAFLKFITMKKLYVWTLDHVSLFIYVLTYIIYEVGGFKIEAYIIF